MSDPKGAISKPSIVIRVGNISVRIRTSESQGYRFFQVADYSSGHRRLLTFKNEVEARRKAGEIAHKMASGQLDVLQLSSDDRAAYARAIQLLKPPGFLWNSPPPDTHTRIVASKAEAWPKRSISISFTNRTSYRTEPSKKWSMSLSKLSKRMELATCM